VTSFTAASLQALITPAAIATANLKHRLRISPPG
jgi:hypothetical protein